MSFTQRKPYGFRVLGNCNNLLYIFAISDILRTDKYCIIIFVREYRHNTYLEELAHTIEGSGPWKILRYQENMKLVLQEIKSDIEDLEKLLV